MCGIIGIWNLNRAPVDPGMLDRFTDTLAHRGPDGRGTYIDQEASLGLGHRRLAIIDTTESGSQPMPYSGGRYWITYNGEIYNFLELKSELGAFGYTFTTDSDTEVILAAYDKWGEDCQLRFNGMWAFAIWDRIEQKLFLSRDRFGIKPLHYLHDGKRFAFASEMKAFPAIDGLCADFDPEMIALAITSALCVEGTEFTLFKGVKRLLGGFCMTVQKEAGVRIRRWWNTLDHLSEVPDSYDGQVEKYKEIFLDACRIRMRSDVPLGACLSGGLDSSSILCSMAETRKKGDKGERLAQDWQNAFIAMYPGTVQDETLYAKAVVDHTGTRPFYVNVNSSSITDLLDSIIFHYEDISDVAVGPWLVYREQRKNGIVVSLDGHGGDEALGGYPLYLTGMIMEAMAPSPQPVRLFQLFDILAGMYIHSGSGRLPAYSHILRHSLEKYYRKAVNRLPGFLHAGTGKTEADHTSRQWLNVRPSEAPMPVWEEDSLRLSGQDALFRALYRGFHSAELPTNLRDFDRLSMSSGIEVRSPFCDWRLVTYTFSLPSSAKIGKGFTKRILRDAMKGSLPEHIRVRTSKIGFSNPLEEWVVGPLRGFIMDTVRSDAFRQSEVWKGDRISREVEQAFKNSDSLLLGKAWTFIHAAHLMRVFKERARS